MARLTTILALPITLLQKVRARFDQMLLTSRDAVAMAALAPLSGPFIPITCYSMRPSSILTLANDVVINRRRNIVEFGPGLSTLYLARLLRALDDGGQITSFDHDAGWLEVLATQLRRESLGERVTLVHAPLAPGDWGMGPAEWYVETVIRDRTPGPIDLLVVDGPPAHDMHRRFARYPALGMVRDRLAADCTIALDDAKRRGEREITARWVRSLGPAARAQFGHTAFIVMGDGYAA